MIQNTDPLREIIRYEELLKATSQRIEIIILDNKPEEVPILKELISEEEQLVSDHSYRLNTWKWKLRG